MISVDVTGAGTTLRAVGSKREFKMRSMHASDYPHLPQPTGKEFTIKADTLSNLLELVSFSAALDESRPQLNCALFEANGGDVRMVTTDGHRLTTAAMDYDGPDFSMLVPQKTFAPLRELTGTVHVSDSPANVFFETEAVKLSFKKTDAAFPPWRNVMPKPPSYLIADRALLADALRAMTVSANTRTTSVTMQVTNGTLRLTSESSDGTARDEFAVDYTGSDITVAFSARYMLDALGVLTEPQVRIGLDGTLDPIKITPESARDYTAVIMPVRL